MDKRLATLLATQVAQVQLPVPARPTFRVENVALFCTPASGGTISSTAIENLKWVKQICSSISEGVFHILRHGITAFKEQLKLVNGFERYMR
jgi:hypothetical protein